MTLCEKNQLEKNAIYLLADTGTVPQLSFLRISQFDCFQLFGLAGQLPHVLSQKRISTRPAAGSTKTLLVHRPGTHKAALKCPVQQFFRQSKWKQLKIDQVDGMGDDVPRLAAAKLLAGRVVVLLDKSIDRKLGTFQALGCAITLENLDELLSTRVSEKHLVLDSPQKCFVSEALRLKVGRENQEGFERHLHLAAGVKTKIIHATVHRDNPAVQDFGWAGLLPAKIVD